MHARRFDINVINALRLEPLAQIAIHFNQTIFRTAGDPKKLQLLVRFRVEPGKIFVERIRNAARTEGADPGKFVEIVQTRE